LPYKILKGDEISKVIKLKQLLVDNLMISLKKSKNFPFLFLLILKKITEKEKIKVWCRNKLTRAFRPSRNHDAEIYYAFHLIEQIHYLEHNDLMLEFGILTYAIKKNVRQTINFKA
jgi:hypothetical protein